MLSLLENMSSMKAECEARMNPQDDDDDEDVVRRRKIYRDKIQLNK